MVVKNILMKERVQIKDRGLYFRTSEPGSKTPFLRFLVCHHSYSGVDAYLVLTQLKLTSCVGFNLEGVPQRNAVELLRQLLGHCCNSCKMTMYLSRLRAKIDANAATGKVLREYDV